MITFLSIINGEEPDEYAGYSDEELVALYRQEQDQLCIYTLLVRYAPAISVRTYEYLKNQDSMEDVAQDLFLKLQKSLLQKEVKYFGAYFKTMLTNYLKDIVRRKDFNTNTSLTDDQKSIPAPIKNAFELDQLNGCISKLTKEEQQVILMLANGYSYKEIMKTLDLTFNQVRGYRDRGLPKLKKCMGK